ncbi:putative bax inhibitor family protein [Erysiphe necator]|uniref:Putative bax inhibitor family protein n=1 Tax=Uncinula necator TaxID=52586 RepID=A0A0B1PGD8_UNCNE|nr:putative bax inhibitor family protein [Erysiphe necator]
MTQPILLLRHSTRQLSQNAANLLLGPRITLSSFSMQGLSKAGSTGAARRVHNKTARTWSWIFTSQRMGLQTWPFKTQNGLGRAWKSHYHSAGTVDNSGSLMQKLVVGGAMFGGTLIAINLVFNRETREDGSMPAYERSYLNDTFLHTGLGIGIIGLSARAMFQSGAMYRMMATSPWIVMIGGLGLSMGTMMATRATDPTNYVAKYGFWAAFNGTQGALLAPLLFLAPPALIARAGLYTMAIMGSISFVGATAKQEKYLYLGGPLLAGAALVAVSGLAPMVLPATAVRTLAISENLWLYGGLAVFGGFTLYDVQKVLMHARMAQQGLLRRDAVNESISLELDFLNIFVRVVQILMMQQSRRK